MWDVLPATVQWVSAAVQERAEEKSEVVRLLSRRVVTGRCAESPPQESRRPAIPQESNVPATPRFSDRDYRGAAQLDCRYLVATGFIVPTSKLGAGQAVEDLGDRPAGRFGDGHYPKVRIKRSLKNFDDKQPLAIREAP